MIEKILGEITFAEYGIIKKYPYMIGLLLEFDFKDSSVVMTGSKYTVGISKKNCLADEMTRITSMIKNIEKVVNILNAAKCNYVSELIGKPVEVTLENNTFKDFRILTEGIR